MITGHELQRLAPQPLSHLRQREIIAQVGALFHQCGRAERLHLRQDAP
jgi:hypothetical protein